MFERIEYLMTQYLIANSIYKLRRAAWVELSNPELDATRLAWENQQRRVREARDNIDSLFNICMAAIKGANAPHTVKHEWYTTLGDASGI